jgi:hypothetical protein
MIDSSERYQRMRDVYETCARVRREFTVESIQYELLTPVVLNLQESLLEAEKYLPYGASHGGYAARDRYDDLVRCHVLHTDATIQQPRPLWRIVSVEDFAGNMYDRKDYTMLWKSPV